MSPPRIVVDFLSFRSHSLDAIWRIGSSPRQKHQYQWYTGQSNDRFWPDTQGTEVHRSSAIDFNEGRISSSVPEALIIEKVLITSAQMKGVRAMCNTMKKSCQQKAAMMQIETNFFFFFSEHFLHFSCIVSWSTSVWSVLIIEHFWDITLHTVGTRAASQTLKSFEKLRGGDPSDPDFARRMDAILVIEGEGGCQRWVKLKVNCVLSEEKQD